MSRRDAARIFLSLCALGALALCACSTPRAVTSAPPTPPRAVRIKRIAVQPLEGTGSAAVMQELLKNLAGSGLEIADRKRGVDALLVGNVVEYKSGRKQIVILGNANAVLPNGQTLMVSNPVVSLGGPQVTLQNAGLGLKNPQIVVENAAVTVALRLVDVPSGQVLWADQYGYESLELPPALQTTVSGLVRSLARAAPQLQHPK